MAILLPQPLTAFPVQIHGVKPRAEPPPTKRGSGRTAKARRRALSKQGGAANSEELRAGSLFSSPAPMLEQRDGEGDAQSHAASGLPSRRAQTCSWREKEDTDTHSFLLTPLPAPSQRAPLGACSSVGHL